MKRPESRLALRATLAIAVAVGLAFFTAGGIARADDAPAPANDFEQQGVVPMQQDIVPVQQDSVPMQQDVTPSPQDYVPEHQDSAPAQNDYLSPDNSPPPDEAQGGDDDPLVPFNEKMFTFNLKLDEWILRPVASGYAAIAPQPVRQSVGRFFDNVGVIPRFANNLFQLRFPQAGEEVARFGINSTLGLAGFFDPADSWFGLKEHKDDFGLTLRYYGAPTGPYVMLPFLGPSTVGDTIGLAVDHAMNPMSYLLPWPWYIEIPVGFAKRGLEAINYRSLRMDQFEAADRYAIDLYGAVQDAYLQKRAHQLKELKGATPGSSGHGSMYALIAAPSTLEYPYGNWQTPRGQWSEVSTFPDDAGCQAALEKRGAMGEEHPLECLATDSREYSQILTNSGR
ncbi:MAG: MlaA family lipoprotein [Candidatus Binatus sp.]|uniref:MlaA family lipoprotein n=1 Tax=Candidatus Binatus sp. TaxID=2811406 RepID=UPI002716228A|nr:MlaA family lipoprotein [Candidatus Binatus sp.]MDO8431281.1 MlaA family lipoprotein [Candidatus Binatus sp.]